MKQTLALIADDSILTLSKGLNSALNDLREELGEDKYRNDLYCKILELSIAIDSEYISRERKKAGL